VAFSSSLHWSPVRVEVQETKVCKDCKVKKPTTDFPPTPKTKSGRAGQCGDCIRAKAKARWHRNKELFPARNLLRRKERRLRAANSKKGPAT
jgi:hypothetical protein